MHHRANRVRRLAALIAWPAAAPFAAIGGTVLAIAFAAVCWQTGTLWPWSRVVHEDGRRTLLQTIFYFEHAVRELPLDIILGLAIGSAMRSHVPPAPGYMSTPAGRRDACRLGLAAALIVTGILVGALIDVGPQGLLDNFAQLHTRSGAPLVWGAHWRYHLLERLAIMLLSLAAAGLIAAASPWSGAALHQPDPKALRLFKGILLTFAVLTLLFVPSMESFTNPQFIGHQARELLTHALVTFPLGLAACLCWVTPAYGRQWKTPRAPRHVIGSAVGAVLLGGYLAAAGVATGARSAGQTSNLMALVFPHFFEHSLTYLLTPFVAASVYLMCGSGDRVSTAELTSSPSASAPLTTR